MIYRLADFSPTHYIMVVGCGGTGGVVAEGICRLIAGSKRRLYLVDMDRVETKNLKRQNFFQQDLGKFKAEALARRLSAAYNMQVDYLIGDITALPLNQRSDLTIGCVDNTDARDILQYSGRYMMGQKCSYVNGGGWYIDAGNGEYSGQVLIGNCLTNNVQKQFNPFTGICSGLPLPQIQQPALLAPMPKSKPRRDCAEAVEADEQSPVINQAMAALVLNFVHRLLTNSLTLMGCYLDLESGAMTPVAATPEAVSRITGHTIRQLEYHPWKNKVQARV